MERVVGSSGVWMYCLVDAKKKIAARSFHVQIHPVLHQPLPVPVAPLVPVVPLARLVLLDLQVLWSRWSICSVLVLWSLLVLLHPCGPCWHSHFWAGGGHGGSL